MLPKLTADEHQAWRIYKAFRAACQANKVKNLWQVTNLGFNDLSQIDDFDRVRSHRNWHHYVGTWKRFKGCEVFNARELMHAVFRNIGLDDKVYPGMLNTKRAERDYFDHVAAMQNVHNSSPRTGSGSNFGS